MTGPMRQKPWLAHYDGVPATFSTDETTALEAFRSMVAKRPDGVLIRYFDQVLTAKEIDGLSDSLAAALQQRGVQVGERVAMYLQNVPQAMITVLAAWKCGAVTVPCNPMLKERELAKILVDSGSRVLVCHDDLYEEFARPILASTAVELTITTSGLDFLPAGSDIPAPLSGTKRRCPEETVDLLQLLDDHQGSAPRQVQVTGEDVAFMVYTSGTTGAPKAAMNTHANVIFAAGAYQRWMGLTQKDVILGMAPLFHVTGLVGHLTLSLLTGAALILSYRFDADETCRLAERYRATFTVTAVTAFIALLNTDCLDKYDLSSLSKVYTGGAPTPTSALEAWRAKTGTPIHPMYGLTEVTSPATMTPFGTPPRVDQNTGVVSIGVPVPNTNIRIVTEAGAEAEPREIGELRITGPQVVPGYWQLPEETAMTFTAGELRTGDVGFMDEDGWIYLVDRAKDMIVASGFKVWPSEVEEVLYQHPAVREAAVVGIPDPYRGENVKAVVSLRPGHQATEEEIKAFARERMAAYKYPRIVEIVQDLPKTTGGKILRRMLQPAGPVQTPPTPTTDSDVRGATYPELRDAVQVRTVLEIGATWLRLTRENLTQHEATDLYEKLHDMLAQVREGGSFIDKDAFLDADEAFHQHIVDLVHNDHLSHGFRELGLRQLFASTLRSAGGTNEDVVSLHERLTDAVAAGNPAGAREAIVGWGEASRASIHKALDITDTGNTGFEQVSVVDDLALSRPREPRSPAGDITALASALEARAALEIGITQLVASAEASRPERERLVARLRAAIPLIRGTGLTQVARYTRADDSFHRVFFSLLRNQPLFNIYNRMDIPELLYRVLKDAPPTTRDVIDNHQELTAALLEGDADAACTAIARHTALVMGALRQLAFHNDRQEPATEPAEPAMERAR